MNWEILGRWERELEIWGSQPPSPKEITLIIIVFIVLATYGWLCWREYHD